MEKWREEWRGKIRAAKKRCSATPEGLRNTILLKKKMLCNPIGASEHHTTRKKLLFNDIVTWKHTKAHTQEINNKYLLSCFLSSLRHAYETKL